ncbi:MAG: nucleotidyltransferase domain-containing protein [Sedimentisphaerales bacterium]|nr:nucleotidyltransferase domain-containing protein [Sedimentisphaerales bacterium]
MEQVLEEKRDELREICRKHYVRRLDVFGSAAGDDFTPSSDIDFVVEFDASVGNERFDNYFELLDALKELFDRQVDLIEPGVLQNPFFLECLEQTRRPVYVAS